MLILFLHYVCVSVIFPLCSLCRYTRTSPLTNLHFHLWQLGKCQRVKPSSRTDSLRKHTEKLHLDISPTPLLYSFQATGLYLLPYDIFLFSSVIVFPIRD